MTVVMCLNYGDKIYVATDSLMTSRRPNGLLKKQGYRLKLYKVPNCHAVVAFSGHRFSARTVLRHILQYAEEQHLTEESLFMHLPSFISEAIGRLPDEHRYDVDIMYAGLTPNSKAYNDELFPGAGIPPQTFCAIWRWKKEANPQIYKLSEGHAVHVRSGSPFQITGINPKSLMDLLVTGSGGEVVIPDHRYYYVYYGWRHQPPDFMMALMGEELSGFFPKDSIEILGVGGEYQVALITEDSIEFRISLAGERLRPVTVEFRHGAYIVAEEGSESEFIQTIWDDRLPMDFREMGYLL